MIRLIPVVGLVICLMAALAGGQARQPAKPELLANVDAVQPGESFLVGVYFKLEPKWHTYWKHAGQAGIPTEIKLNLPEGFRVGEISYPVPIKFNQPGDIIGYGYEDEVLFTAFITAPSKIELDEVPITASADWLVCADVCIPGEAKLTMTLPVRNEANPANTAVFEKWHNTAPIPVIGYAVDVVVVGTETMQEGRSATNVSTFRSIDALKDVDFYPIGDPALNVDDIDITRVDPNLIKVRYTVSPLTGRKQWPKKLQGLLVYTTAKGKRHGTMFEFPAPALPDDRQN